MQHSNVNVNDVNLAYQAAGEGQPLLCVHGNFGSKRWFNDQLSAPPKGWRVIALDLPNFADSAAMPEPISIAAYADYLHGFIEALQLAQPVVLGHSLGGSVVQSYAAKHPTEPRGLVLVSSASPAGLVTAEEHYALLESLKGNFEGMAQALSATVPTGKPEYFEGIVDDALKLNPTAFSGNARALEHPLDADLTQVTCPVLVIRCEHDYLVSEDMAQETAQAFPNAELELWQGIGHSPQVEDPARFNQRLNNYLEGLP